ncbi:DMT family transporter [Natronohydrobacter thiooxidans]|jgi:drug/metabolite transporter (DMT)-like permease|uniref:DMT family transporter n=1 Tax=Natronohydrobacter thiooxidans TaxID=87172 RepID=UPI0008FF15D5|nr:DMT family transporter [Natronohydrobacter thiooxidans]
MGHQIKAAFWMGGAILSFITMSVAGRAVQAELSTFELMFWRSLIGLVLICGVVLALARRRPVPLRPTRPGLHALRHVVHFAGQNLWFYALMLIPLAQLVALEFTMPIWVALLAPLVLGEIFTRRRILVALLGFAGVLIVAQPGTQALNIGHLAALGAAVGFALNIMLTKRIMREDGVLCVLFWMSLSQGLMALALSLWGGFTWPSSALWGWIALVGVTGLSAHYALTSALALAPATTVAPMEFLRLPLIALVGLWLYAEALDPLVFLGAGVILLANWINLRRADAVLPRQILSRRPD